MREISAVGQGFGNFERTYKHTDKQKVSTCGLAFTRSICMQNSPFERKINNISSFLSSFTQHAFQNRLSETGFPKTFTVK